MVCLTFIRKWVEIATYFSGLSDADVAGVLFLLGGLQVEDVLDGGVWVLSGDHELLFLVLVEGLNFEGDLDD